MHLNANVATRGSSTVSNRSLPAFAAETWSVSSCVVTGATSCEEWLQSLRYAPGMTCMCERRRSFCCVRVLQAGGRGPGGRIERLPQPITLDQFELGVTLGTGSFGRVRFVVHKVRLHSLKAMLLADLCCPTANPRYLGTEDAEKGRSSPTAAGISMLDTILCILSRQPPTSLLQVEHIMSEKSILSVLDHPFIVQLGGSFQGTVCGLGACRFLVCIPLALRQTGSTCTCCWSTSLVVSFSHI